MKRIVVAVVLVALVGGVGLTLARPWGGGAGADQPAPAPTAARTSERGVIANCLGVDLTPPFTDPRTGDAIEATAVITYAASMRGYAVGTEVTVPMVLAGIPDSLIEIRAVLGPDGRLEGAAAVTRPGTYNANGFDRTFVIYTDPTTGVHQREDRHTREFLPRDGVTVGTVEIPCDKNTLPPGSTTS